MSGNAKTVRVRVLADRAVSTGGRHWWHGDEFELPPADAAALAKQGFVEPAEPVRKPRGVKR